MKKRIWFLVNHIGSGHKRVAFAIACGLKEFDCQIFNIFDLTVKRLSEILKRIYLLSLKVCPNIWKSYYFSCRKKDFFDFALNILAQRLFLKIKESEIDAIISTQSLCSRVCSLIKTKYNLNFLHFSVLTDFCVHRYWLNDGVDLFFSPHPKITEILIQRKIDNEKIKTFGMPILLQPQNTKKEKIILISGGGEGLGLKPKVIKQIVDIFSKDYKIVIVCGKNQKAAKRLKKLNLKNTEVLGYVDKIEELLSKAELLIAKPGGVTVWEAIQYKLPIIPLSFPSFIEKLNWDFLKQEGLVEDGRSLIDKIKNTLKNSQNLIKKMEEFGFRDSTNKICQTIKDSLIH